MKPARPARNAHLVLAGAFALIFALVAWDLVSDYREGVEAAHVLIETLVLGISGPAFVALLLRQLSQQRRMRLLAGDLEHARRESGQWRDRYRDTVRGLAEAIGEQLDRWGLSAAEAEVAMLLLKGLSLREIAEVRGTGDRTVRDQARAVYRKSGLANRSALSAFFLEDLLPPMDGQAHEDVPEPHRDTARR